MQQNQKNSSIFLPTLHAKLEETIDEDIKIQTTIFQLHTQPFTRVEDHANDLCFLAHCMQIPELIPHDLSYHTSKNPEKTPSKRPQNWPQIHA